MNMPALSPDCKYVGSQPSYFVGRSRRRRKAVTVNVRTYLRTLILLLSYVPTFLYHNQTTVSYYVLLYYDYYVRTYVLRTTLTYSSS